MGEGQTRLMESAIVWRNGNSVMEHPGWGWLVD